MGINISDLVITISISDVLSLVSLVFSVLSYINSRHKK